MKISIHQPNYLPWLGYFHKMAMSDIFVLLDDAQYPRGKTIISRVKIKTANGLHWLTVPVKNGSRYGKINDINIADDPNWQKKHWRTIEYSYQKAPYFEKYASGIKKVLMTDWQRLINLNAMLIRLMKDFLNIEAKVIFSSEISDPNLNGKEKIFNIIESLKADVYITGQGQGSKRYINPDDFKERGIKLINQDFRHPVYPQMWDKFEQGLSIIDMLFNCGVEVTRKALA